MTQEKNIDILLSKRQVDVPSADFAERIIQASIGLEQDIEPTWMEFLFPKQTVLKPAFAFAFSLAFGMAIGLSNFEPMQSDIEFIQIVLEEEESDYEQQI